MPSFRVLVQRARSVPFRTLPPRVISYLAYRARIRYRRRADARRPSHISDRQFAAVLGLTERVTPEDLSWSAVPGHEEVRRAASLVAPGDLKNLRYMAAHYRAHRVEFLGPDWVSVGYDAEAAGVFGHQFQMEPGPEAEREQLGQMGVMLSEAAEFVSDRSPGLLELLDRLKSGSYRPIDWHLDFRSGYRWNEDDWFMDVPIGPEPGADIKMPWELSRSHQLVTLALEAAADPEAQHENAVEIALELLDWITSNPPRSGVNWRVAMEVGIRAANWIWALSILGPTDELPPALRWMVNKSLYEHGIHIRSNLERYNEYTTNHYLADLAGLLQIAISCPQFPESSKWTAFCLSQLEMEMESTVLPDGVNYELSTGYHRLVTEMFAHSALLAARMTTRQRDEAGARADVHNSGLDFSRPEVFDARFYGRLKRMFDYIVDITKPNGLAIQFGDQDSGRFIPLGPVVATHDGTQGVRSETRDFRHLLSIGASLFTEDKFGALSGGRRLDGIVSSAGIITGIPITTSAEFTDVAQRFESSQDEGESRSTWYPYGGTCILERDGYWVGIRCVPANTAGPGSHRHNDQLSFELNVDGVDFVVGMGSGVYTSDVLFRNLMRSTSMHSTAKPPGQEQNNLLPNADALFVFHDRTHGRSVSIDSVHFSGQHSGYDALHTRRFELGDGELIIHDSIEHSASIELVLTLDRHVRVTYNESKDVIGLSADGVELEVTVEPGGAAPDVHPVLQAIGYGNLKNTTRVIYRKDSSDTCLRIRRVSLGDS